MIRFNTIYAQIEENVLAKIQQTFKPGEQFRASEVKTNYVKSVSRAAVERLAKRNILKVERKVVKGYGGRVLSPITHKVEVYFSL